VPSACGCVGFNVEPTVGSAENEGKEHNTGDGQNYEGRDDQGENCDGGDSDVVHRGRMF